MNIEEFPIEGTVVLDGSNPNHRFIAGLSIFTTGPIAERLRKLGYKIERKVEVEQASVIIWLLAVYEKYKTEDWEQKVDEILTSK